ncbi:MAG: segregation/condensation protein A [Trichlorobacter sp.]|jgi:segregation and condensation protein A|nr:segregation/condensation protein A [Trichlorobacter sp.]
MQITENQTLEQPANEEHHGYNVKLDVFEGPLDLLLHLIRKNELDIYDIPIALITRQYLDYIRFMQELNLELMGDFLVMASTLLQIKSRMLLPLPEPEDDGEEEQDPRAELVQRLVDYQRYRDAGLELGERELLGREQFKRLVVADDTETTVEEEPALHLELFELVEAFRKLLARLPVARIHEVAARETLSIVDAINDILEQLHDKESITFDELFSEKMDREHLVVCFLALLELCRIKMVRVMQPNRYGTIMIINAVMSN